MRFDKARELILRAIGGHGVVDRGLPKASEVAYDPSCRATGSCRCETFGAGWVLQDRPRRDPVATGTVDKVDSAARTPSSTSDCHRRPDRVHRKACRESLEPFLS